MYVFRFFKNFQWVYVIIDDRLPCEIDGPPIFGQCKDLNELWVPLIEKAYAKLHGCYQALISGFADDALTDMTGLVAEKVTMFSKATQAFPHESIGTADQFWDYLKQRRAENSLMGCSRTSETVEVQITLDDGQRTGVLAGHAYGLLDVFELPDEDKHKERKTHRLLRIRNPHGHGEYQLDWSDNSQKAEEHLDKIRDYIQGLPDEDERFEFPADDGTFLINYKNFRQIFNSLFVCIDFPNSWSGIRYTGNWDSKCAGGLPIPLSDANKRKSFAKNPQYCLEYKTRKKDDEQMELFISLTQPDGRGEIIEGLPVAFPYKEVINPVIINVFKLGPSEAKLTEFDKTKLVGKSILKEHREISVRLKIDPGKYVIVPSAAEAGQTGEYHLTVYFNKPIGHLEFSRLDAPDDEYEIVREESEAVIDVPAWKEDLC